MPVKKFKPVLTNGEPTSTDLPPPSMTQGNETSRSSKTVRGQTLCQKNLKTSESETRPKAESPPPAKQKHYPNGNKGWKNLEVRHANMRERLKGNWNVLSGSIMDWLLETDEQGEQFRLKRMLEESKLKDIGVMLGISTEKVLLLEGQPTQIIGHGEQKKLDELLPALLTEVKRRGAKVELTERKAEINLDKSHDVA